MSLEIGKINWQDFVRPVVKEDAARLLEIYSYYVKNTAVSYEYDVPSVEEFESRIEHTTQKYPYLCVEKDGKILGYAYAGTFHTRAAYQWDVELSIYVDRCVRKSGLGRCLYHSLEEKLKKIGILNMYACIAVPNKEEDEYLTYNSEKFHEHMGFRKVGTFYNCAKKFNRWYGMIWMEKFIGEHE